MRWKQARLIAIGAVLMAGTLSLFASVSFYPLRPDDAKAVYLIREEGGLHGDGIADDTEPIQQAIDKVQETTGQGIVFIPGALSAFQDCLCVARYPADRIWRTAADLCSG